MRPIKAFKGLFLPSCTYPLMLWRPASSCSFCLRSTSTMATSSRNKFFISIEDIKASLDRTLASKAGADKVKKAIKANSRLAIVLNLNLIKVHFTILSFFRVSDADEAGRNFIDFLPVAHESAVALSIYRVAMV